MKKYKFEISEEKGSLNFGVFWVSLDGRIKTEWFSSHKEALKRYYHLKKLGREPSFNIRIEEEDLK